MNSVKVKATFFGMLGVIALLVGCGGGGGGGGGVTSLSYTGNTDPAAIDGTNAEAVGVSVTEGATETIGSETADASNPFGASLDLNNGSSPLSRKLAGVALQVLRDAQSSDLPVGATLTTSQLNTIDIDGDGVADAVFCGGSVTISDALMNGSSESGSMTFNNLCFDLSYLGTGETGTLTINGGMSISVSGTTETVTFSNLSVTTGGETYTFSGTEVCDTVTLECSTLFVGSDGQTYMAADVSVTGDDVSGYDVSATFSDPTYGVVTVTTTTPIIFNSCPGGVPYSGVVSFSSSNGSSGAVTFIDCANYSVAWNDGVGGGGTIAGVW